MRFTIRELLAVTAALAICCALVTFGLPWLVRNGVAFHQRNVARELIKLGDKFAQIDDDASAIRAAEMIEYIEGYYVVGGGYRGTDESETELETTRADSLRRIINALEAYTGYAFGNNHSTWAKWAESQIRGEKSDAPESLVGREFES